MDAFKQITMPQLQVGRLEGIHWLLVNQEEAGDGELDDENV
jgi:hypothetical protein